VLLVAEAFVMPSRVVIVPIVPFSAASMSAAKVVEVVCEFFAAAGNKAAAAKSPVPPFADSVTVGITIILDNRSLTRSEYVQECIDEAGLLLELDKASQHMASLLSI
jgi:hypothetical protein